jgi:CheY-like chemotaxis protein
MVGTLIEDITRPEDRPRNAELYRRLYESGESFFIEKCHLRRDGSEVWVNSHVSPIRNAEGKIEESVAVVVDVTERKRAERELALAKDRLATDLDAMTRLQKIGALFVQKGDLPAAIEAAVEAAVSISGADKGNIQFFDTASGKLVIKAQRGFERPFPEFWGPVKEGMGACGATLKSGERVIVEDVPFSPIFAGTPALDVMSQAGVRAVQSTPVMSGTGKLMAVFSTHYATPGRPDERTLRLPSGERFDVLICDIGMPKEDGYTVMRKAREAPPDKGCAIPAIALTAYGRAEDRLRALSA